MTATDLSLLSPVPSVWMEFSKECRNESQKQFDKLKFFWLNYRCSRQRRFLFYFLLQFRFTYKEVHKFRIKRFSLYNTLYKLLSIVCGIVYNGPITTIKQSCNFQRKIEHCTQKLTVLKILTVPKLAVFTIFNCLITTGASSNK